MIVYFLANKQPNALSYVFLLGVTYHFTRVYC